MSGLWRDPDLDALVRRINDGGARAADAAPEPEVELEPVREVVDPDEDVDALVDAVAGLPPVGDARRPSPEAVATIPRPESKSDAAAGDADPGLDRLLARMVARGASDLLLVAGQPPALRVDGRLVAGGEPIAAGELRRLVWPRLAPHHVERLERDGAADLSLRLAAPAGAASGESGEAWRFRLNVHRQRGELAVAVRALPGKLPTLESLRLPAAPLREVIRATRGLVLVCGPTGSGKTSTLAALIDEINRSRACHVLTIEDPVEYEHRNRQAVVEQIEVGSDSPSFAAALVAAMRQDPDVILVGEMRDHATVAAALTAAETGHLVLSTLHTNDVVQAVHRIVDIFPAAQQPRIRQQLALALHAFVGQQLVPRRDGRGRVAAVELLLANYAIRSHIRNDQLHKIYNELTLGKKQGMVTLEDSLARLVREREIELEEARIRSARPDELDSLLRI